jgi:hypothetical protein
LLRALAHAPNYSCTGPVYFGSSFREDEATQPCLDCAFPSQHVADRRSKAAVDLVEELCNDNPNFDSDHTIDSTVSLADFDFFTNRVGSVSDKETQWILAIRTLTSCPGVAIDRAEETVGRPYADAMRELHRQYRTDPDVACGFVESLMVLNVWRLLEYPTGQPISSDLIEARCVLEHALALSPSHPGLCHMYIHLLEMSEEPHEALAACKILRANFPDAGHLVHMPTHIGRFRIASLPSYQ